MLTFEKFYLIYLIIFIISIKANTKPFCTRIFPSTLSIAGIGWIRSAEEIVCRIGHILNIGFSEEIF